MSDWFRSGFDRNAGAGEEQDEGTDDTAGASSPEELAELRQRVSELEDELADKTLDINRYAVRAADAENELEAAKQRLSREAAREAQRQRDDLLRSLLEVVDNLDRALDAHVDDAGQLVEGVRLVRQSFIKTLADVGVEPIDAMGQPFSPAKHEAIAMLPATSPNDEGRVMAVAQKGYTVRGEILRPAKVAVGKRS